VTKDEWKQHVARRVKDEIYSEVDMAHCVKQINEFVFLFGGEGLLKGAVAPPHGKYEVWTRDKLESEIMKQFKEAKENLGS